MRKPWQAVLIGVASFFPYMFLGETIGLAPAFVFVALYYFVAQLFLSRGEARAYSDWTTMLALDASTFLLAIISTAAENQSVLVSQTIPLLVSVVGGTFAGAVAASLAARRWPGLPVSKGRPNPLVLAGGACVIGSAAFAVSGILGRLLAQAAPGHEWWLGAAIAFAGGTVGSALGAHMADRGQGRLTLVVGAALVTGTLTYAVWVLARIFQPSGQLPLLAFLGSAAAVLVTAVYVERLTALRWRASPPGGGEMSPES